MLFIHLPNCFPGQTLGVCEGNSKSAKTTAPGSGRRGGGMPGGAGQGPGGGGGRRGRCVDRGGGGGGTTKSVLNTGKLPQEGAQSPRAGSSSGRGKATGSPRSQAPEDAEHPPAPPGAWVPHGGHLLPRVCLGRGGKPGWWEGEQASLQGSLGSWHPEACLRTKTRVQGL